MNTERATLSQWLARLETFSPSEINLGLERMHCMLDRLSLRPNATVLLVAGTNGKGSSVAMADVILRGSGKTVGTYTSPHVHRYNERITVNGVPATDGQIIAAFETIEEARADLPLTYFEFGTLAALLILAAADLDVWVLEIGLGGRLDACNAISPSASLITNISLDHSDWLGHDIESIAAEKAGVMRNNIATVFAHRDVPDAIVATATSTQAVLYLAERDFKVNLSSDGLWNFCMGDRTFSGLQRPGLIGEFQIENAAAVLALLEVAGLAKDLNATTINQVLPALTLPGRMQATTKWGKHWCFDVAHNAAASAALARNLADKEPGDTVIAIIGLLADKDTAAVVRPLLDKVERWIAVTPQSERAVDARELARRIANLSGKSCLIATDIGVAMEFARHSGQENDRIVVTGSFFTVGPALRYLQRVNRP